MLVLSCCIHFPTASYLHQICYNNYIVTAALLNNTFFLHQHCSPFSIWLIPSMSNYPHKCFSSYMTVTGGTSRIFFTVRYTVELHAFTQSDCSVFKITFYFPFLQNSCRNYICAIKMLLSLKIYSNKFASLGEIV